MVMAMAATKHDSCDQYFKPLYQAIEIVMQRVYGESDAHRNSFVDKGHIIGWNEKSSILVQERWIDTLFGISALLSLTTQLNYSRSQGKLCMQHGLPFLRLAQAASANIAIHMIDDSLIHLSSLRCKSMADSTVDSLNSTSGGHNNLIDNYWKIIVQARDVVEHHLNSHQLEMVFAQFQFRELITKQWIERKAA